MYKLINDEDGNLFAIRKNGITQIPLDPANTDYEEYLEWVADGNTPEEAD